MVYDVITDEEAEKMKEMAKPQVCLFSRTLGTMENWTKKNSTHVSAPYVMKVDRQKDVHSHF